jgi:hypothetical protein
LASRLLFDDAMLHRIAIALALVSITAAGCSKKKDYPAGCTKAVPLVAPWTEMNLPIAGGRVCEADDKHARIDFLSTDTAGRKKAFEDHLLGLGYTKADCMAEACNYVKDTDKTRLNVLGGGKMHWVTVHLNKSAVRASR